MFSSIWINAFLRKTPHNNYSIIKINPCTLPKKKKSIRAESSLYPFSFCFSNWPDHRLIQYWFKWTIELPTRTLIAVEIHQCEVFGQSIEVGRTWPTSLRLTRPLSMIIRSNLRKLLFYSYLLSPPKRPINQNPISFFTFGIIIEVIYICCFIISFFYNFFWRKKKNYIRYTWIACKDKMKFFYNFKNYLL